MINSSSSNTNNNRKLIPAHLENLKITPQDDQDDQSNRENLVSQAQFSIITTTTTTKRRRSPLDVITLTTPATPANNSFLNSIYNNDDSLDRSRLASHHLTTSPSPNAGVNFVDDKQNKLGQQEAVKSFNSNCTNNLNVRFKEQQQQQQQHKSITRWFSGWSLKLLSLSSSSSWPSISTSSSPSSSSSASAATAACITFLILSTTCSLCSASLCESQSWWDPYKDRCIPCTVCQGDMIPLRPCQMHRDTVCGSIYDLKIDWVFLSKTEPNWKERRKFDGLDYGLDHHQLTAEQLQQLQDETDPMDWQTAALFLAVLACLLFFIVAACILVHHMRQWRRMERRLDQDVEELSTKLMAKLAEVQSLEGGTFFIGNAEALRIPTTLTTATANFHQPQHVLLPEKSDKNQQTLQHDRRLFHTNMTTLKSGNVYIEENSSKC